MRTLLIQFNWIIDDYDHNVSQVIDPLVGHFDQVFFLTTHYSYLIDKNLEAMDYCRLHGISPGLWLCPGEWARYDPSVINQMPASYNLMSWVPSIPEVASFNIDWLNWILPEVRDWTTQQMVAEMDRYNVDAVVLDYMRWPVNNNIVLRGIVSPDTVTVLEQQIAAEARARNLDVVGSCVSGWHKDRGEFGTPPSFEAVGQHWPDWIRNGNLDWAHMMTYSAPSFLSTTWEGVPADVRNQTFSMMKPAYGNNNQTFLSAQDIADAYTAAIGLGGCGISAFIPHAEYPTVIGSGVLSAFDALPPMPPFPPPPPPPPTDIETRVTALEMQVAALEGRTTALEVQFTTLDSRVAALETAHVGLQAQVDQLATAQAQIEQKLATIDTWAQSYQG